jgi:hypothetical protein
VTSETTKKLRDFGRQQLCSRGLRSFFGYGAASLGDWYLTFRDGVYGHSILEDDITTQSRNVRRQSAIPQKNEDLTKKSGEDSKEPIN